MQPTRHEAHERLSNSLPGLRVFVAAFLLAAITSVYAQQIWVGGGFYGGSREPPRFAKPADHDGRFMYCRGYYQGGGWRTDYPGADNNFSVRLAELTTIAVKFDPNRQPHYIVVPLSDPLLFRCPMLFMENVGTARFSPAEVQQLREFLLKGGSSGPTTRGARTNGRRGCSRSAASCRPVSIRS